MKKVILSLIISLCASAAFAGDVETVGVKGMVCSFCAQGITKTFKGQKEVEAVEVSLENKFMKLTYKDGQKLSHESISKLLKDAGYEASFSK